MLEKLEKKINEIKSKLDARFVGVFMFAVFGTVVLIAMNFANVYAREKDVSTDSNNRSMYEVITAVNNLDTLVAKLRITKTSEYNIKTLAGIIAEANLAKDNLSELPVNQGALSKASKFLSQVLGYSESLIKKLAGGGTFDTEDYTNLEKINNVSDSLNATLKEIYTNLISGKIKWNEVEKVATAKLNENNNELDLSGITKIKDTLEDYEGLIYDGAFSEHIEQKNAAFLTEDDVSVEEASKKVRECVENAFLNLENKKEIEEIIYTGETSGNIAIYNFEVKLKDEDYTIYVDISKQDGTLVLLMSDKGANSKKLTIEQAKKIGDDYLISLGLKDFEPTYYLTENNMTTINYAKMQDDVLLYPDLIKVKVSLDTGEVCSVECRGYIFNHKLREDITPIISENVARQSITSTMEIENIRLAIIPTDAGNEVLTYEIKGIVDKKTFLIYINAKTGVEENVLILLETEGGILTI